MSLMLLGAQERDIAKWRCEDIPTASLPDEALDVPYDPITPTDA